MLERKFSCLFSRICWCKRLNILYAGHHFQRCTFHPPFVAGYITNSMALVADSFHMLSDIAALVIAFLSGNSASCCCHCLRRFRFPCPRFLISFEVTWTVMVPPPFLAASVSDHLLLTAPVGVDCNKWRKRSQKRTNYFL